MKNPFFTRSGCLLAPARLPKGGFTRSLLNVYLTILPLLIKFGKAIDKTMVL